MKNENYYSIYFIYLFLNSPQLSQQLFTIITVPVFLLPVSIVYISNTFYSVSGIIAA
jgi:hypothetical protein